MSTERRGSKQGKKRFFFKVPELGPRQHPCVDISLHGLLIKSTKYIVLDKRLDIQLMLPDGEPMICKTKVSWIRPNIRSAPLYKVGLAFIDLSPEDKERLEKNIS